MPKAIECAYTITGKGPPVFMVHGIGARRATWDGLVERIKDDFTCITYELRGTAPRRGVTGRSASASWSRTSRRSAPSSRSTRPPLLATRSAA